MPTGYTAKVGEEDNFPFEDFVWDCARNFGALSHMRDYNSDAKIVLPQESFYHKEALLESEEELKRLEKLTLEQAQIECDEEYERKQKYSKEQLINSLKIKSRYEQMLNKCEAWAPPTSDHQNLKKFMIGQLNESISFDCSVDYCEQKLALKKPDAQRWLKDTIMSAEDDVTYHTLKSKNSHEKYLQQIEWIMQLQHSIPIPISKKSI